MVTSQVRPSVSLTLVELCSLRGFLPLQAGVVPGDLVGLAVMLNGLAHDPARIADGQRGRKTDNCAGRSKGSRRIATRLWGIGASVCVFFCARG